MRPPASRLRRQRLAVITQYHLAMVNPNASPEWGLGCGFTTKLLQREERSLNTGLVKDSVLLLSCGRMTLFFQPVSVLVFLFKVKNLRNFMFSLTSLRVFSLRGCSYYLYIPALCSCLGCCSLSEITHWVCILETGISFVVWYLHYNTTPAGVHSSVVTFLKTWGKEVVIGKM